MGTRLVKIIVENFKIKVAKNECLKLCLKVAHKNAAMHCEVARGFRPLEMLPNVRFFGFFFKFQRKRKFSNFVCNNLKNNKKI